MLTRTKEFSIAHFQQGDRLAFEFIYAAYYPAVRYFANRYLHAVSVADDVTQEAFLHLWRKHRNFSSQRSIRAFLYVVTKHACINLAKKQSYQRKEQRKLQLITGRAADPPPRQDELKLQVLHAIQALPPQCRKVIEMSYLEGFPNREIAQQLSLSVSTVKNQKVRGISLLKKRLRA